MIISNCQKVGSTINDLAKQGIITPVSFIWKGKEHKANSILAACDYLKEHGYYQDKEMVVWKMD